MFSRNFRRIWSFNFVVLQRTAKKYTKNYNARTLPLFSSLNLLFCWELKQSTAATATGTSPKKGLMSRTITMHVRYNFLLCQTTTWNDQSFAYFGEPRPRRQIFWISLWNRSLALQIQFEQVFRQICALNGLSYLRNSRAILNPFFSRRRPWRLRASSVLKSPLPISSSSKYKTIWINIKIKLNFSYWLANMMKILCIYFADRFFGYRLLGGRFFSAFGNRMFQSLEIFLNSGLPWTRKGFFIQENKAFCRKLWK